MFSKFWLQFAIVLWLEESASDIALLGEFGNATLICLGVSSGQGALAKACAGRTRHPRKPVGSGPSFLGAQRDLVFGVFWFALGLLFGLGCLHRLHLVFDDCVSLS